MYRGAHATILAWIGLLLGTTSLAAQDTTIAQQYADGVHALFAGDYETAATALSRVIQKSDEDPRAHFFRGAAYWALGQEEKAEADFRAGAEREVFGPPLAYSLNDVLERIQGKVRMRIEAARDQARERYRKEEAARKAARYEALRRAKQLVLYPPRPLPAAEKILKEVKLASLPSDPFATGTLFASGKPAPEGSQKLLTTIPVSQPAAGGNGAAPAADQPAAPAAGDPFGSGPAPKPAPSKPEKDDPFGDDPFGN